MHKEETLQTAICSYIKYQYPNVIFTAESSGVRLTIGQAKKAKNQRNPESGLPDLIILEPNKDYHGLCLELKRKSPYLKNGELSQNKHIQNQYEVHKTLNLKGYLTMFVWSFEMAKEVLDQYINQWK